MRSSESKDHPDPSVYFNLAYEAVLKQDKEALQNLLKQGFDINATRDPKGFFTLAGKILLERNNEAFNFLFNRDCAPYLLIARAYRKLPGDLVYINIALGGKREITGITWEPHELIPLVIEGYAYGDHQEEIEDLIIQQRDSSFKHKLCLCALNAYKKANNKDAIKNLLYAHPEVLLSWIRPLEIENKTDEEIDRPSLFLSAINGYLSNNNFPEAKRLLAEAEPSMQPFLLEGIIDDYLLTKQNQPAEIHDLLNSYPLHKERLLQKLIEGLNFKNLSYFKESVALREDILSYVKRFPGNPDCAYLLPHLVVEPFTLPAFTPLPTEWEVTEESKNLFARARDFQGFAVIVSKTKKGDKDILLIHLVPAFNKDDGKIRKAKDDAPFPYVESPEKLGANTGIIHEKAIAYLKETKQIPLDTSKDQLLGAGIFKGNSSALLHQFRICSANINQQSVMYNREFILANYFSGYRGPRGPTDFDREYYIRRELPPTIANTLLTEFRMQLPIDSILTPRTSSDNPNNASAIISSWGTISCDEINIKLMTTLYIAIERSFPPEFIEEILRYIHKNLEALNKDNNENLDRLFKTLPYGSNETLFTLAIKNNPSPRLLKILLDQGVLPEEKNSDGDSPLKLAVKLGKNEMVATLLEENRGPQHRLHYNEVFILSAKQGRATTLELLLQYARTPLIFESKTEASYSSYLFKPVEPSKKNIFDIEGVDANNNTALAIAAVAGQLEIVELLLKYGANPRVAFHVETTHIPKPIIEVIKEMQPAVNSPHQKIIDLLENRMRPSIRESKSI